MNQMVRIPRSLGDSRITIHQHPRSADSCENRFGWIEKLELLEESNSETSALCLALENSPRHARRGVVQMAELLTNIDILIRGTESNLALIKGIRLIRPRVERSIDVTVLVRP